MTQREENESRRRRMRLAEAVAGTRRTLTIHRGRTRSTITGKDEAEVERLRAEVNELHARGCLGERKGGG